LKAVRALVANEPELSSQVVKAWLTEDDWSREKITRRLWCQ
jgi:hypothetical protein